MNKLTRKKYNNLRKVFMHFSKTKITLIASAITAIMTASSHATTDREYENRWLDPQGDPLLSMQWNLLNDGHLNGTHTGVDLNLWQSHIWGHKGQNIKVAVIDDGVDIVHPDLIDNIIGNNDQKFPGNTISEWDNHGTKVAGIIAAVQNSIGVRGVAPEAKVVAYNFLTVGQGRGPGQTWDFEYYKEMWLASHGEHESSKDIRVFNQSYGGSPAVSSPFDTVWNHTKEEVFQKVSLNSQGDQRTALYVKSAGNGYEDDSHSLVDANFGLPWQNSNDNYDNANYWNVTMSALNADGFLSSYSTVGSSVFLTAPGGNNKGTPGHTTATISCDTHNSDFGNNLFPFVSCQLKEEFAETFAMELRYQQEYGQDFLLLSSLVANDSVMTQEDKNTIWSIFSSNETSLNTIIGIQSRNPNLSLPDYIVNFSDYNNKMAGTSSAAPNASGAIALLMSTVEQQKHDLTARDIRHLLAMTATKVDPERADINVALSSDSTVALEGWTENQAKNPITGSNYEFSPFYGFGLVDVDKAAELIRRYAVVNLPSELVKTPWLQSEDNNGTHAIQDFNTTISYPIEVNEDLFIEGVQIRLNALHERITDLKVEIESPSGTRSILMSPFNSLVDEATGYNDHLMLTYKFWNEKSNAGNGQWKLHITDVSNTDRTTNSGLLLKNNSVDGELLDWSLRIIGHKEKVTKKKSL